MSIYLETIFIGLIFFTVLFWFILLFTYLREYRRNGMFKISHAIFFMSFILYIEIAYFLTILPLPQIGSMTNEVRPLVTYMQLNPLNFITEITNYTRIHGFHLMSPPIYTNVFNVFLLMPLGVYLNKLFDVSFTKSILIIFLVSLSFEVIQLSGLFFIYPYPYRVFDVNDLMFNTLGGILGYLISRRFLSFLDKIDLIKDNTIFTVTYFKQLVLFIADATIILIMFVIASILSNLITMLHHQDRSSPYSQGVFAIIFIVLVLTFLLIPIFRKKYQTLSMILSNTSLVNDKHDNMVFRLLRTIVIYLPFILSLVSYLDPVFYIINVIYVLYLIIMFILKKRGMNHIDRLFNYELISNKFKSSNHID